MGQADVPFSPYRGSSPEVPGTAMLGDLDAYLRAIWLECCGHMSQFSVGEWRGTVIDMEEELRAVFRNDVELTHTTTSAPIPSP